MEVIRRWDHKGWEANSRGEYTSGDGIKKKRHVVRRIYKYINCSMVIDVRYGDRIFGSDYKITVLT